MQIVSVQLNMVWEDKPANHRKATELLNTIDIEPGGLIILPEMFDTGFSMNLASTAQSTARESEEFLKALAHKHQAAVMGGVAGPIVDQMSSNEAVVFSPSGSELVRYRKMQPFSLSSEGKYYGRGDRHGGHVPAWE